jgi:hypothetical protein
MDLKLGHLRTLADQSVGDIEEFIEVFRVFGLTRNRCQGLMADYRLLLFVLDAFSNQVFVMLASDLTQDKAYFVL